jgi:spermidine synthase
MKKNQAILLTALFFLSGFCNLVYEIVWARQFNLVFGVTVFAVSAVLAAFMLGLALGSVWFGRIAEKAENTVRLFSLLHGGIFLSTLLLLVLFPYFQGFYLFINSRFSPDFYTFRIVLFLLSMVLMIVPTTLMGATFPVASKLLAARTERFGRDIGILYSINTLGSVIGCAATIFFLLGSMGMRGTIALAAAVDLLICLAALVVKKSSPESLKSA